MEAQLELGTRAWNRKRRRTRILEQAGRLFDRQGIDRTSMEQIARAAGCTRRTLYAYFESWDDLAHHVYLRGLNDRWALQQEAMRGGETGLAKLRIWGETFFEYSLQHPQSMKVQFFRDFHGIHGENVSAQGLSLHLETVEPIVKEMRAIFIAGQKEEYVRDELDVDSTLAQYAYTLRAVLHRALFPAVCFAQLEAESFVHQYIDLFMRGIATRRES